MINNLIVVQKLYDFELIMYGYLKKYPVSEKFAAVSEIKNTIFSIYKKIYKASVTDKKKTALFEADIEIQHLKHMIRLSHDMKWISPKGYEVTSKLLVEIGAMIGSWIKGVNN